MGKRRQARELTIQVLFQLEFGSIDPSRAFDLVCENFDPGKSIRSFSRELVMGVSGKKKELDGLIRKASKNWRVERMPRVDRCILRLAAYEMLFMEDIPIKVTINESVEMGKRFGTEDSGRFINGVVDEIFAILVQEGRMEKSQK